MWMIPPVVLFLFFKDFLLAMTNEDDGPYTQFLYQFRQNYRQTAGR
ncbi:MAG: hypothetical protein WBQ43_24625 [Terriglobales bacterium]